MYRKGLLFCLVATLFFSAGCATKKAKDETAIIPPPPTETLAPAAETTSPVAVVAEEPKPVVEPVAPVPVVPVVAPVAPAQVAPAPVEPTVLQSVPFEYDQHLLTDEAREILAANVTILKAQNRLRVTLAGYCDERGADQYNIALGERRAESVRNYLLSLGISEGRLEAVSYGEEKPLDPGHDESAWSKNRRVEFVPLS